ncbi:DUF3243 domain-containing protein [Thalassobacillus pellis]|uniref:DUF3243 domain-containing protein n=1 Tax=Thalassobacillus pellis TaxID=748008 RepID=UPI00195FF7F2|nr:DUF3243 domain-containing protein [Thalassobacillus pellis]MBM7553506.1 DNA-binding response OmpR family regulator [Thalassobacillus pellis]
MANNREPEKQVKELTEEKKDEIMASFSQFRDYLGDKVEKGEKMGLSEEALTKNAKRVADYLAEHEEPRNREEKLLNEMWNAANEDERKHVAHVLVKLADETNK